MPRSASGSCADRARRRDFDRTALVALHGSWNRTRRDGYKVVALRWGDDGRIVETDFLTGFLGQDGILGRPAGIATGPAGEIFVADDYAGVIYRIVPDDAPTVPAPR